MITTNDLEPLSKDLTTITTEIKSYENTAGQSIFEIGRRLKWVKEHDLVHGEFDKWLSDIHIERTAATRMMKVSSELSSNYATWHNLGTRALYLIATMPKEERERPQKLDSGETKKPEDMTVRELRETKRKLKQREQEVDQLRNKPPKVVEKQVNVVPDDYHELKEKQSQFNQRYQQLEKQLEETQKSMHQLADEYDDVSRKYSKAKEAVSDSQVEWAKNKANYSTYRLVHNIDEFIAVNKPLDFQNESLINADDETKARIKKSLHELISFANDIDSMVEGKRFIEGEVTNNE